MSVKNTTFFTQKFVNENLFGENELQMDLTDPRASVLYKDVFSFHCHFDENHIDLNYFNYVIYLKLEENISNYFELIRKNINFFKTVETSISRMEYQNLLYTIENDPDHPNVYKIIYYFS